MARTTTAAAEPRQTSLSRRGHGNPAMLILLGLLLLAFAFLVITLQTQTNEAYLNGLQQQNEPFLEAQWSIWLQLPKLMFGTSVPGPSVGPNDLPGVIIGQGVELTYLSLIAALEIALHSTRKLGRILGVLIVLLLVLIAIFDFWADLVYGTVPFETHVVFAVFCTLVVGFFPTWGLTLIEHGWRRL